MEIVQGDLLQGSETVIAHQVNGHAVRPHGLSEAVARRFPYADVYGRRATAGSGKNCCAPADRAVPGTIVVDNADKKHGRVTVVHLVAQAYMGKPGAYAAYVDPDPSSRVPDTAADRLGYFRQCLGTLEARILHEGWTRVAFPHLIGCGLAGGEWEQYRDALEESARRLSGRCRFVICKLSASATVSQTHRDAKQRSVRDMLLQKC